MKNAHHARVMAVHVAKVADHVTKAVHAAMARVHVTKVVRDHATKAKVHVAKTAATTIMPAVNK